MKLVSVYDRTRGCVGAYIKNQGNGCAEVWDGETLTPLLLIGAGPLQEYLELIKKYVKLATGPIAENESH